MRTQWGSGLQCASHETKRLKLTCCTDIVTGSESYSQPWILRGTWHTCAWKLNFHYWTMMVVCVCVCECVWLYYEKMDGLTHMHLRTYTVSWLADRSSCWQRDRWVDNSRRLFRVDNKGVSIRCVSPSERYIKSSTVTEVSTDNLPLPPQRIILG